VEQVELMKRLWTEDSVTHKGRFFHVEDLSVGPRPIQKPHPPLWTGGSAEAALKRAGTWANGFISGSAAIADFHVTWDKIASYAVVAGRNPKDITKASLAFMAINDDKAKAVKTIEDYTIRYYGRVRAPVEPVSVVGSPEQCIDKIHYFLSKGFDQLIIGVADPDPRQLDLFGEKVLPKVKN
jgi:alkanesulfonate monooxygenase SsuD/methylene tetrahydromethanopterin reductase-like flavin-dependent oxidoreductase (luciferase family)